MSAKNVSRRKMLKLMGVGTATMGLAACAAPQAAAPAAPSAPAANQPAPTSAAPAVGPVELEVKSIQPEYTVRRPSRF